MYPHVSSDDIRAGCGGHAGKGDCKVAVDIRLNRAEGYAVNGDRYNFLLWKLVAGKGELATRRTT